jgi:hypothetical protein
MFIPDLDLDVLPIPDPDSGIKMAPDPGSRILIRNTGLDFISSRIFHGYAFVNFMYNYLFYITLD